MKISKKLTDDLKATSKEKDGLYCWISASDAKSILTTLKSVEELQENGAKQFTEYLTANYYKGRNNGQIFLDFLKAKGLIN